MVEKNKNQQNQQKETMVEILSFQIGKQEFAIDVDSVELVIERTEITPVPNSRMFIEGVMNLRGRIVPVVDLTRLISIEVEPDNTFENVLIVKQNGTEVGFFVNEVREVINTSESDIDTGARTDQYDQKVKGIVQRGKRLILFLDIEEILRACEGI
ncbi:MAG TPA: chemotaxis protein CheW [Thermotogota bacterium]|nr:chemotaxis protein CheW [Thermotogota bacterium]HRW92104.1 chemotaxis protein CheW [Thermotogota bacterium]